MLWKFLKIIDFLFLQFLFIRVYQCTFDGKEYGYGVYGPVIPLTGYFTNFTYPTHYRVSKILFNTRGV